jgi:hypothetical protein
LATNQPVEFLSRASVANQSTGRVSLLGLGIVVVGYQTKRPSWFLHRMVRPRPPSTCTQGAQKGLQATNRAPIEETFSRLNPQSVKKNDRPLKQYDKNLL